jgi:hypothetical protein
VPGFATLPGVFRGISVFVGMFAAVGCAKEVEHAPFAEDICAESLCTRPPLSRVSGSTPASMDAGMGDAGSEPVAAEGTIVVVETPDLLQTRPLEGASVELVFDARTGERTRLDSDDGSFESPDVGANPYWVRVRPTEDPTDLLATLTRTDSLDTVLVFERRAIEDVADNLTLPVALDPTKGHAIFNFVRDGLPLQGVALDVPDGRVAYDSGTLFSDGIEATQERGAAVALNVAAVVFPGGSAEFEVLLDGSIQVVEIELSQDAVTVVTLSL